MARIDITPNVWIDGTGNWYARVPVSWIGDEIAVARITISQAKAAHYEIEEAEVYVYPLSLSQMTEDGKAVWGEWR